MRFTFTCLAAHTDRHCTPLTLHSRWPRFKGVCVLKCIDDDNGKSPRRCYILEEALCLTHSTVLCVTLPDLDCGSKVILSWPYWRAHPHPLSEKTTVLCAHRHPPKWHRSQPPPSPSRVFALSQLANLVFANHHLFNLMMGLVTYQNKARSRANCILPFLNHKFFLFPFPYIILSSSCPTLKGTRNHHCTYTGIAECLCYKWREKSKFVGQQRGEQKVRQKRGLAWVCVHTTDLCGGHRDTVSLTASYIMH